MECAIAHLERKVVKMNLPKNEDEGDNDGKRGDANEDGDKSFLPQFGRFAHFDERRRQQKEIPGEILLLPPHFLH